MKCHNTVELLLQVTENCVRISQFKSRETPRVFAFERPQSVSGSLKNRYFNLYNILGGMSTKKKKKWL